MALLSNIYYRTINKLNVYDKEYLELESKGYDEYIEGLKKENLELKNCNEMLREANTNMALESRVLEGKIEGLEDQFEINEILKTDEDFYNTNDKDNNSLVDIIDKITGERNIYKETINIMCDEFNIDHYSVLNIIDAISPNKSKENDRV